MDGKKKCDALKHPSFIPSPDTIKHVNLNMLTHYRSWGIVDGRLGCSPSLRHTCHIYHPYLGVSVASSIYHPLTFFLTLSSISLTVLIKFLIFWARAWFSIYSSKQNLHTSLCDKLPSLILPFLGWFTVQSLYVATISLRYYHLKTLIYVIFDFLPGCSNLNNTVFTVAIII